MARLQGRLPALGSVSPSGAGSGPQRHVVAVAGSLSGGFQRRPHPGCQARHPAQGKGQSALAELLGTPASELTSCGNPAHYVVELGPGGGSPTVAVADEIRQLLGRTIVR